jgi:glycosyltransferase involved in cell wall biosynthesis
MTAADLFFLPSIYEGFPRVLMEAAAAGKPIVSADVSGSDDVIENGRTGYIVAINDRDGFTDRIAALLNDPSLCARMGAAGRERMRSIAAKYADPNLQVEIWRDAVRRDRRKKTQERSA